MHQKLLFSEQAFNIQEKELLISNHLKYLIQNFDNLSRIKIKNDLLNLFDILERYS
jgi:hypothetical protein